MSTLPESALEDPSIPGVIILNDKLVLMQTFKQALLANEIPQQIVDAISLLVSNVPCLENAAYAYARHMGRAYYDYGVTAIPTQVMYLLLYMSTWQGEEARATKKLLRSWSKRPINWSNLS